MPRGKARKKNPQLYAGNPAPAVKSPKPLPAVIPKTLKDHALIFYMKDDYHDCYRVWRRDWPGDCFEMIPKPDFETCLSILNRISKTICYDYEDDFMSA